MADPFNARVLDSGGGEVRLMVERDTDGYPEIGTLVRVVPATTVEGELEVPTLGDAAPLQPCPVCLDARHTATKVPAHRCPNDAADWPTEPAAGCLHVDTDAGGNCRNPLCGWNSDWARATEVDADD